MQIFLDTANIDEIRQAHAWGVIDGVTTNPSLIAKNGKDFIDDESTLRNDMAAGPESLA